MAIWEFFKQKNEEFKEIGSFECTSSNLVSAFTNLSSMVGLTNPKYLQKNSGKGILITKKGDKYVIKLLMFKPPVELEWSNLKPLNQLFDTLDEISRDESSKIGSVNFTKLQTGHRFFQLALSR